MRQQRFAQRRRAMNGDRRRMGFQFPPEIVKKYDQDGDGQLNEEETQSAQTGIQKMFQDLQAKYDSNGNGRLDPEEMDNIQSDKAAGKLEDVPQIFLQMGGRRQRRSSGSEPSPQDLAKQMDKNRDGRLDEGELEAARAELKKFHATRQNARP